MATRKKLGELLIEQGAVSEADIRVALGQQKAFGNKQRLGEILVSLSYTNTGAIARALALQHELPYAELPAEIAANVTALVSVDYQYDHRIIPFKLELEGKTERLHIAVDDPAKIEEVDDLRFQLRKKVKLFVASVSDMDNTLAMLRGEKVEEIVGVALDDEDGASASEREKPATPPGPVLPPEKVGDPGMPSDWDLPQLSPKEGSTPPAPSLPASSGPSAASPPPAPTARPEDLKPEPKPEPRSPRPPNGAQLLGDLLPAAGSTPTPIAVLSFPKLSTLLAKASVEPTVGPTGAPDGAPGGAPPPPGEAVAGNDPQAPAAKGAPTAPPAPAGGAVQARPETGLEFTDDDLKMLDTLERIALGAEPLKPGESVNANYMIFTLIRLLINKGVIQEHEILEELAKK